MNGIVENHSAASVPSMVFGLFALQANLLFGTLRAP